MDSQEPLFSIVYLSTAVTKLTDDGLAEILDVSRKNNPGRGITGLLAYCGGNFIQYLEGPKDAVESLYEKICKDPRHNGLIKMDAGIISERVFSEWSMSFRHLDIKQLDLVNGEQDYQRTLAKVLQIKDRSTMTVFLKTCLSTMMESDGNV